MRGGVFSHTCYGRLLARMTSVQATFLAANVIAGICRKRKEATRVRVPRDEKVFLA